MAVRASRILSVVVYFCYQVVGCSDAVNLALERPGRSDPQQSWTVLIYEANQVESLDVSNRKLTPIASADSSARTGPPGMASFSPDGAEITFKEQSEVGGDYLVVLNLKNGTRRLLFKMPYLDGPRWSPDGTGIAFEGRLEASGDYSLYFYTLANEKTSMILEGQLKGGEMLFSWAPDGKTIVFQSTANDIYVLDLATRKRTRVDSGWFPTWSPSGRYLAYRADGADDPGYTVYDLRTRKSERILRERSVYRSLVWSPDSRYLVYAADGRGEYYGDLFILDLETKKETRLLRHEQSLYPTDSTRSSQPQTPRAQ